MTYETTRNRLKSVVKEEVEIELPEDLVTSIKTASNSTKFGYFDGRKINTKQLRAKIKKVNAKGWYLVEVSAGVNSEHERLVQGLFYNENEPVLLAAIIADIEDIGVKWDKRNLL